MRKRKSKHNVKLFQTSATQSLCVQTSKPPVQAHRVLVRQDLLPMFVLLEDDEAVLRDRVPLSSQRLHLLLQTLHNTHNSTRQYTFLLAAYL